MAPRQKLSFRLDRNLGQHLLEDRATLLRIIQESGVGPDDHVLEIGPGTGNLTSCLLQRAGRVVAVEFDPRFREKLETLSRSYPGRLSLHFGDFLGSDLPSLLGPYRRRWKVIANIPYNITSPIVEKLLLQEGVFFTDIYLTVQKEIALRLCAEPGSRASGTSTLFVRYYTVPSLLFTIPSSAFLPPPEVDSALIHLKLREKPLLAHSSVLLFPLIHHLFRQRRKGIRNSLKGFPAGREDITTAAILERAGIDGLARPETLSLEQFNSLAHILEEQESKNIPSSS
jgi:16S rRNA (adenine1518-N6/adenine1519-N6)-dimethyltransferase